jgi:hypothetical protein
VLSSDSYELIELISSVSGFCLVVLRCCVMLRAGVPPLTRASSGPRSERGDLFLEQERLPDAAKHTTGTTTNGADRASQTLKNVVICSEAVKCSEVK